MPLSVAVWKSTFEGRVRAESSRKSSIRHRRKAMVMARLMAGSNLPLESEPEAGASISENDL